LKKRILERKRKKFFIFGRVQKGKVRFFNFWKSAKRKSKVFSIFGRVQKG
jgi:hypothetical protein